MNPKLNKLQSYPFEKMAGLKKGIVPADLTPINLSIGEPKHPTPALILSALADNLDKISEYPLTKGNINLRQAIQSWLIKRFSLKNINPETEILPVTGTREALFAFAQAVIDETKNPLVLMTNPFYQIYEGAALLAGAEIQFINLSKDNQFQPDFSTISKQQWQRCQLIYICSPNNPTGSVLSKVMLKNLIKLSQKYDFIIASDECYSEIYFDESAPPAGLLEVACEMGIQDYHNCVVFHSLSKRSNAPGLRSGFVAGDATILQSFLLYRTYHGCAMPPHHQIASVAAWQDENHVIKNRKLYREKFKAVTELLELPATIPDAGFYLWLKTPTNDLTFTKNLFEQQNITVIPGQFLSRSVNNQNPAAGFIRLALVANLAECLAAAKRINQFVSNL